MTKNTVREILTSIRNAVLTKSVGVEIPKTRMTKALAKIILEHGLIERMSDFRYSHALGKKRQSSSLFLHLKYSGPKRSPIFTNFQCVSRVSLRFYTKAGEIPQILSGSGLVILSTSQGLITGLDARSKKLGGEVICSIWLLINPNFIYEGSIFREENM